MTPVQTPSKTVVFLHGNFVSKHCWRHWVERYEALGYTCHALAFPGREGSVAELKANPDAPILSTLTLAQTIDHLAGKIRALPEPPILIGHSFGGFLTQLMLQRDLGVCGVAIDSAPPQGVLTLKWSFFRSTWAVLNPLIPASRPFYMSFEQFQYAFGNDLTPEQQRAAYDADIVPESRRLVRGALTSEGHIDFARRRAPLLLIAGGRDHIVPAALNRVNYRKYAKSPSVTDFHEFPNLAHYSVIGGPGWQPVADYAIDWANRMQATAAPAA